MKKTKLEGIELDLYEEILDNGLAIYIIPKTNVEETFVTFTTKYGSIHNDFIPLGETEMYTVPAGVAHFLEHKVFEQKDGEDVFTHFESNGANPNANTWFYRTAYLFNGKEKFSDNMNFLLDYVQSPYFTDENVLKEKGIIEQEIKMYLDDPVDRFFETSRFNAFINDPIGISVIGTTETINKITTKDLYKCYNTFYHPSNMFVFITGNVDPIDIINIIRENQSKKDYPESSEIILKEFDEPTNVRREEETIKMDIKVPKVSYNLKLQIPKIDNIKKRIIVSYISMFFDLKFGNTSSFNEEMRLREIITNDVGTYLVESIDYLQMTIYSETNETRNFIGEVRQELISRFVREEDFNRIKKVILSNYLRLSENMVGLNYYFLENIVKDNEININDYNEIKNLNFHDFKEVIELLNFDNNNIVIVEPK